VANYFEPGPSPNAWYYDGTPTYWYVDTNGYGEIYWGGTTIVGGGLGDGTAYYSPEPQPGWGFTYVRGALRFDDGFRRQYEIRRELNVPVQVSASSLNEALGRPSNQFITLNDGGVRGLAAASSPYPPGASYWPNQDSAPIMFYHLWGKTGRVSVYVDISYGIAGPVVVDISAQGGYVPGKSDITINHSVGNWHYSDSVSQAALAISGGEPGDTVTFRNSGIIMGKGGRGGNAIRFGFGSVDNRGEFGGPAMEIYIPPTVPMYIINNGSGCILGGGGGGGGLSQGATSQMGAGGGGAGGGDGGIGQTGPGTSSSGVGGGPGSPGGDGGPADVNLPNNIEHYGAGGGGRILPGTPGPGAYGGAGVVPSGGNQSSSRAQGGGTGGGGGGTGRLIFTAGGNGGSDGNPGVTGAGPNFGPGGGGGYGASGGDARLGTDGLGASDFVSAGGEGGYAIYRYFADGGTITSIVNNGLIMGRTG
jgi:hypothetical protein